MEQFVSRFAESTDPEYAPPVQKRETPDSISDDDYIVAPVDKQKEKPDATMADEDTQDAAEDEQQLNCVMDWISAYHLDNVDVTDVLSNFPDISLVLIEEIMDKLVKEGILLKAGNDSFNIRKPGKLEYEFDAVKEEATDGRFMVGKKSRHSSGEDHMYMKALYHALPMNFITVSKLQTKLGGEANQTTVQKLMDKMTKEGYIEATNNRRLGKRVIHSDLTNKKLAEVQKALDFDAVADTNETNNKSNQSESHTGTNRRNTSTFGALHYIGSDLTRTKGRSDLNQNGSTNTSDPTVSRLRENGHNTPTSNTQPIASIESYTAGIEKGRNEKINEDDKMDVVCSRSTLDKCSRKASTVKEPILQSTKREKPIPTP